MKDKDGWSTYQLWVLIGDFGDCFQFPGFDPPFETEIEIVIKKDEIISVDNESLL